MYPATDSGIMSDNGDGDEPSPPTNGHPDLSKPELYAESIRSGEMDHDWITEMDKEILEVLNTDLTLTPSIISENIDRAPSSVSRRLDVLRAGGLVWKKDRGKYHITDKGRGFALALTG